MKLLVLLLGLALALGAAVGLGINELTASGSAARSGKLRVAAAKQSPPGRYVQGAALVDDHGRRPLSEPGLAPLVGGSGPIAAPSPDGRLIAYNSWRWTKRIDWTLSFGQQGIETGDALGLPRLRVLDLQSGKDDALEPGTFSIAWRSDGALAYVRGDPVSYRANLPFLDDVYVRARPTGKVQAWTTQPDRYLVDGWAGTTLIVERGQPGGGGDILALDQPGSVRVLARSSTFLAISPEGNHVLVAQGVADVPDPKVSLVDVSSGKAIASMPISSIADPTTGMPIQWIGGPGDWRGGDVALTASSGLVVLNAGSDRLAVEQVLHLDSATRPNGMLWEPRFTDDSARSIVTWSDVPGSGEQSRSVQFTCDRYALRCARGAEVPSAEAPRPVYDESGGAR
jgi:hypothetical protein